MPLVTKRTMPPHQNHLSRNGVTTDSRFPKHQLMSMYTVQKESGELDKDLTDLFLGGWQPGTGSHANATLLWTPRDEHGRDAGPGPDICWDRGGNISPLGLREMNNDEKEVLAPPHAEDAAALIRNHITALLHLRQLAAEASSAGGHQGTECVRQCGHPQNVLLTRSE